ncbi:MAG: sulfotransferase domain-containing protein [Fodinibius sp.]|nr:sulfotransferase domain-containing protein [Fodinibius sp.]
MKRERKVDFMIVGAQKCGTTTLAKLLSNHSSIVCCDKKEPSFFCSTDNWKQEISDYHSLFQWKEGALHFEASTTYTWYPLYNAWKNLYAYNPDLKIIYIVRNPVDRIVSSYMHGYKHGYVDGDIEKAITEKPFLLNMTRYATQIRPYIEHFGANQVKILFFEDLIRDQAIITNQLSDFLEIDTEGFTDKDIHANKSVGNFKIHHKYNNPGIMLSVFQKYLPPLWKVITYNSARSFKKKPRLSVEQQEMILYLMRNEITELEDITDRNLDSWRETKKVETLERPQKYDLRWYEAKIEGIKDKLKRKLT